ncbi:Pdc2p [Sugiyamaella lignohabitans]|uniref:Pdc2p n=1 Tax=Sugiyamaella lignohabitans TaxID=796027 RepID=A0A167F7Z1_9ASCO|nr:Pdc2p [Sugiyamaella lignohabitans]ANB14929.1 Pdc2p [Sugiyamaella lignohabitans]
MPRARKQQQQQPSSGGSIGQRQQVPGQGLDHSGQNHLQQQGQQQGHGGEEDYGPHDPALIEATNTAAAAIRAATAANILAGNPGNDNSVVGGLKDANGVESYVDTRLTDAHHHHHHHHHGLDAAAHHGLGANLDPAVVGMGVGGHGHPQMGHVHGNPEDDEAAAKAVAAVAAAVAKATASANANGGGVGGVGVGEVGGVGVGGGVDDVDDVVDDDVHDPDAHGSEKPRVKRTAITHEQRKTLREWFFSQDPRPSQAKSIIWFHEKFGRVISQAAISHSLHDRYKHLDFAAGAPSSAFRQRSAQWPELEAILFDYLQAIEKKRGKSAFPSSVSGETLTKAAKTIWQQIPIYADQNPPTFSNGWVSRFKGRYKTYKQYGDATAVDIRSIQQLTANYTPDSIYTMDETSLFWRRPPTASATNKDRSKITLILCTNASGTDKLPLWGIGRAREYRSLANVNLAAIDSHWRSNENAWLTGSIMEEWLQSFYEHVGSRPVLLVMDNFSAHIQGLAESPPPSNVRVQFLPSNSVSFFQPLDKGVVEQFKILYRKHWIDFMVQCYAKGQNPLEVVTMREALRWAVKAWDHDITPEVVKFAFHEASVLPSLNKQAKQKLLSGTTNAIMNNTHNNNSNNNNNNNNIMPPPSSSMLDPSIAGVGAVSSPVPGNTVMPFPTPQILETSYAQLWQTQQLADMIDLGNFIAFSAEESVGVEDVDESEVLQAIINYHLGLSQVDDEDDEEVTDSTAVKLRGVGTAQEEALQPTPHQVLGYLEVVMNFVERQNFTTRSQMRALEEIELELERRIN